MPKRATDKKWHRLKSGAPYVSHEPWDATTGEVSGQGHVSPAALLKLVMQGSMLCDEGSEALPDDN